MTTMLEKIEVFIVPHTLTDGSQVFNVEVGDVSIPADDERHAEALAFELQQVMRDHTSLPLGAAGGLYRLPTRRAS